MGGRSSSKASSTTNAEDRRIVADSGGIGISGDGSSVALSIQTTDAGAIDGAFDLSKNALAWSIGTVGSLAETFSKAGTESNRAALAFGGDALDFANAQGRQAFDFANAQGRQAFDFANAQGRQAFDFADSQGRQAFDFADSQGRQAFDFGQRSFDFAASQAQRADATIRDAASLVERAFSTASDASTGNRTLAMTGLIIAGVVGAIAFMGKG